MTPNTRYYKIDQSGLHEQAEITTKAESKGAQPFYLIDIPIKSREEAVKWLELQDFDTDITRLVTETGQHIRFKYVNDYLYGELAYFSIDGRKPSYAVLISKGNRIYAIHENDNTLLNDYKTALKSLDTEQLIHIQLEFLLYIFIVELLSDYGELIISYREQVEDLALDFENRHQEVKPSDFLAAKAQLSGVSRVLEKINFTLSFPPTRDLLEVSEVQRTYFEDLQKNLNLVEIALKQTEERVESLNDHYQLLLQRRSNKRLKFLTIIQAIFVPITLIAGIYGMNFEYIPLLELKYGYFYSIGIMLFSAILFLWYFYKNDWFK